MAPVGNAAELLYGQTLPLPVLLLPAVLLLLLLLLLLPPLLLLLR
jgi:hypothetical protein